MMELGPETIRRSNASEIIRSIITITEANTYGDCQCDILLFRLIIAFFDQDNNNKCRDPDDGVDDYPDCEIEKGSEGEVERADGLFEDDEGAVGICGGVWEGEFVGGEVDGDESDLGSLLEILLLTDEGVDLGLEGLDFAGGP